MDSPASFSLPPEEVIAGQVDAPNAFWLAAPRMAGKVSDPLLAAVERMEKVLARRCTDAREIQGHSDGSEVVQEDEVVAVEVRKLIPQLPQPKRLSTNPPAILLSR